MYILYTLGFGSLYYKYTLLNRDNGWNDEFKNPVHQNVVQTISWGRFFAIIVNRENP